MIKKICDICKKEFEAPTKNSHICKECQSKTDICPVCGKPKSIFSKTCSRSCGTKLMFQNRQKIQKSKKEENLQKTFKRSSELKQKFDKLQKLIDAGIYDDFEEIPVSIEEFITNRDYLGNSWLDANDKLKAFPFWVEQAKKIFPLPLRSPYHTIILEGATGLGKTSFAVNMLLAYYLYIVMCLKDPHEYFDLADQKKITFAFINIVTKTMAYKNAWGMLHKALSRSPWFMQRGAMTTERNPTWYSTTKEVDLLYGGSPNDLIGLDILAIFIDEINFARIRNVQAAQERAMELFDAAHERQQSRFTKFGGLYEGLMIMASSKRTDQAFTEVFIKKLISDTDKARLLIIDKPRWEVLPKGTYCGRTFPFAVGDKFLPSQIIKEEQVEEFKNLGYRIIYPPIETYGNFDTNMMKAMTDIAGISVLNQMTFLRGDRVRACINPNRQNPFIKSVIEVGCNDNIQYSDYFDMSRVDPEDLRKPMCIHLDASLGGDGNCLSGTIVKYAQYQTNVETDKKEPELHYKQIFTVKVKAPKGDKVMLSKNYQFVMWLKQQGFNIQLVEHDQFQSFEFGQNLAKKGLNTKLQSIDRVTDGINQPYQLLQTVLYEKRIDLLDDEEQLNELVSLELHEDGVVDKPEGGCFTGETLISLCDNRKLSFIEIERELSWNKKLFVYSINPISGLIEPKQILKAWRTKRFQKIIRITLDNNEFIDCTLNHKFMLRDGTYCEAENLIVGQSLMPLYEKFPKKGLLKSYKLIYSPVEDRWHFEHRIFAARKALRGEVVHHLNCNSLDNSPTNLRVLTREDHQKIHALMSTGAWSKEASTKRSFSRSKWHSKNKSSLEYSKIYGKIGKSLSLYALKKKYPTDWEKRIELVEFLKSKKACMAPELDVKEKIYWIEENSGKDYKDLTKSERNAWGNRWAVHSDPIKASNKARASRAFQLAGTNKVKETNKLKHWYTNGEKNLYLLPDKEIPSGFYLGRTLKNHKIIKIEYLDELKDVYDITVKDNHNFALAAGVFVHNSDDSAQALCGSVYGCSSFKAEFLRSNAVLLENTTSELETQTKDLPDDVVASLLANQFGSDFYSPSPSQRVNANSGLREDFNRYVDKNNNNKSDRPKRSGLHFF